MKSVVVIVLLLFPCWLLAQNQVTIKGVLKGENGAPVELVNILVKEIPGLGTTTNYFGKYELKVPADREVTLLFTHIEYKPIEKKVIYKVGESPKIDLNLEKAYKSLNVVDVQAKQERTTTLTRINPKVIEVIPDVSGGIEAVLKAMPGVAKNNELSSQYSVRGGNFDENLVYVNDIEVYRPFLIRSGQQEGLSFVNPDMVASVLFSAGGFDARYGDKMSSVLDIRYKKPTRFAASASASLLGGSAHVEDCSKNHRLTYITGVRYKSSSYVLNSLDTKGAYKPSFTDVQTYITYDITEKFELSILGNLAINSFEFVPETRETSFGTVNDALKLKIYFDGQELDRYTTTMGAITGNYRHNDNLNSSITFSAYHTSEQETFDIQGQYYLNELDKELGSDNVGDSLMNIGVGTFLNHARNYLVWDIYNLQYRSFYKENANKLEWGLNLQAENTHDKILEWEMLDSAGYSLPYSDTTVNLYSFVHGENTLSAQRVIAFVQNNHRFDIDSSEMNLTVGVRAHYWTFSDELLVSPRASLSLKPNWKRDFLFRFATGYYYQPPFYRELRLPDGTINKDIRAQKSIHFVLGSDFDFTAWGRPFKFVTELYYKYLDNIIPYQVDNVRIRYLGSNNAVGYATGIDMKVNGEFVPGVDSWVSLSIMQTREDILDDVKVTTDDNGTVTITEPGYIPRPSDQLINFGMFFQDYLPQNPSYKVHLSLLFATGLPFGPPNSERYEAVFRMPPYRRVDIGFSKVLLAEDRDLTKPSVFKCFKSLWLTFEVFNLLDINNTISYQWISDIYGREYAVPNYLSSRRLNIRLIAKF